MPKAGCYCHVFDGILRSENGGFHLQILFPKCARNCLKKMSIACFISEYLKIKKDIYNYQKYKLEL